VYSVFLVRIISLSDPVHQIRNKRLAKLQAAASASSSASPSGSSTPAPTAGSSSEVQKPPTPVPSPIQTTPAKPSPKIFKAAESGPSPARVVSPASKPKAPAKFDLNSWEHDSIGHILKVTLDVSAICNAGEMQLNVAQKSVAESSGYEIVWLKPLLEELQSEGIGTIICSFLIISDACHSSSFDNRHN
jgi:ubiquitin conjugation factor E4 B